MRITRNELYIEVATLFSKRSTCGRLQVGCIAVLEGRIICTGYNGALSNDRDITGDKCNCDLSSPCQKSIHAEANLISYAAKNGIALKGSTLYLTHSPCLKCSELIIQSGISKVIFKELFRDDKGLLLLNINKILVEQYGS